MIQKHFLAIAAIFLTIAASQAWGAGFALYENSSRGTAICGAFVARADDASALFYNPSGITQLEGRQISNGINTYTGLVDIHYPGGGMEAVKDKTWIVPNFYMSQQVTDQIWIGLGAFAPFGLGNEYEENWFGRYNVYSAEISCMEINPNIAIKVTDSFSFAFGLSRQNFAIISKRKLSPKNVVIEGLRLGNKDNSLSPMTLDEARSFYQQNLADIVDPYPDIDQEVNLEKPAYRFNMSMRYQINEKMSVGFNYRSKVSYSLTGDVKYRTVPDNESLEIYKTLYDAKLTANISLPDIYIIGFAYKLTDQLTVEADIVRTYWSRYDKIDYHFQNGVGTRYVPENPDYNQLVQEPLTDITDWNDVNCYRFGAEYQVNANLTARLGYLFDESPLNDDYVDFSLPGNDRHLFTTGFGYRYKKFIIDGHYGLVICIDKDNRPNLNPNAFIDYEWQHRSSQTHQLGFNVSYIF
jgi:long-chain fatty acid transport protein